MRLIDRPGVGILFYGPILSIAFVMAIFWVLRELSWIVPAVERAFLN